MADKLPPKEGLAPSGFFVLRTPLLPFDELLQWSDGLSAPGISADPDRLKDALNEDRARLRAGLYKSVTRPEVREALFVASPDLDRSIDVWRRKPDSARGRRVERALVRYFSRMVGRATPFGLFAGCSVGRLDNETHFVIGDLDQYRRHTRLDMEYVAALADSIARDQALKYSLLYRPNSSIYPIAGRLHYVEAKLERRSRSHNLVAVDYSDYLAAILDQAKDGVHPLDLATALAESRPDISLADAGQFIEELIDNQLLVPELEPAVTGSEPICGLLAELGKHAESALAANRLEQMRLDLQALDAEGLGISPERYIAIAKTLEDLPAKVEISRLFQVDMTHLASDATLSHELVNEIIRGINLLRLQSRPFGEELKKFREDFVERYENREIPLVEALDEEMGIGFGLVRSAEACPLLAGLPLAMADSDKPTKIQWHEGDPVLLRKLLEAERRGDHEIVLNPEDIRTFELANPAPLPDAFAVIAVVASSGETPAKGDFCVELKGVIGPSGANLFGRFCHADLSLRSHVAEHLRAEEALNPDAVFAEIIHLPTGRLGNVLCRPILRANEIVYLGRSGMSAEHQIPVTDLKLSVVEGRIVLRSTRLGREVIPRLTSAHNYSHQRNLSVYRFLCALQQQGTASRFEWDWGVLGKLPFLPRVTYGRVVLSRAYWNLTREELNSIVDACPDEHFQIVQKIRRKLKLPRFVSLVDADSELPIDLNNILSVESFVDLIKNRESAMLLEMFLNGPEGLCAHGPGGQFVHEIVVPFLQVREAIYRSFPKAAKAIPKAAKAIPKAAKAIQRMERVFPPGSEWLYAKLYTGTSTADQVLSDVVRPIVEDTQRSGAIDRWFFIRYADPKWHLRMRFQGCPLRLNTEVLPMLQALASPLVDSGQLWRIQIDTYEREIERYGGLQGVLLAEEIFHADSEAVLSIVETLAGDEGEIARWQLSLRAIDDFLNDFGLNLEAKQAVIKGIREEYGREFRDLVHLERQLGDKYRKERTSVERVLSQDMNSDSAESLQPGLSALHRRSARVVPIVARLQAFERTGELQQSIPELLQHFTHMHANRIFRSTQRAHEFVLYAFLDRFYESSIARRQK